MKLISLGKIRKPHGFRGAFVVSTSSDKHSSLKHLSKVQIETETNHIETFSIEEAAWMPKGWKIKLEQINSIEEVAEIQGKDLIAPRDWLPGTAPNEFYVGDLIGLAVVKENEKLGELVDIEFLPQGPEVWWYFNGKDVEGFPANTNFIDKISIEDKTVYLK